MSTRRVAWQRSDDVRADEHCTITLRDAGLSLVGTVLGAEGGVPLRIEYRVLADATGATSAVHVRELRGFAQRSLTLARDAKGSWTIDGVPDRALKGCLDVELDCTPAAVSLPIRRLHLGVGGSKTIRVARVRLPELTVHKAVRTLRRLDEFTYGLASEDGERELVADEDGVVAQYAAWQRTGMASGPEDTEPLDAR